MEVSPVYCQYFIRRCLNSESEANVYFIKNTTGITTTLRMSPYHPFDGCDLVQNDRAVKVRFGALWISIRTCSEGPQTALHVEMCESQHLSLTAQTPGLEPLCGCCRTFWRPLCADSTMRRVESKLRFRCGQFQQLRRGTNLPMERAVLLLVAGHRLIRLRTASAFAENLGPMIVHIDYLLFPERSLFDASR
jgi:hypothetical protein